jgi:hypothetical protein
LGIHGFIYDASRWELPVFWLVVCFHVCRCNDIRSDSKNDLQDLEGDYKA